MNKTEISADMSYLVENILCTSCNSYIKGLTKEDPGVPVTPLVNNFLSY